MRILGIETSCDETAVAVVEDGVHVKSNMISSSRATFEKLAGVIPEQAARMQIECMLPVLTQALKDAGVTMERIDAIALTKGPGLLGSLLVGGVTGRMLASIHKKPLIGVHHTLGHLSSTWLEGGMIIANSNKPINQSTNPRPDQAGKDPHFPLLTLSASGGHTDLWLRESHTRGRILGGTRDDAAGEAFDKGASMLGLPYPGGPSIEKAAKGGKVDAYEFPRPLHNDESLDFSCSGLKTSLKYLLRDLYGRHTVTPLPPDETHLADLAASYQHAICRHLTDRLGKAIHQFPEIKEIHIVGGVSANGHLRSLVADLAATSGKGITVRVPQSLSFCTDNGAMIAAAGFFLHEELGEKAYETFSTEASLPLQMVMH